MAKSDLQAQVKRFKEKAQEAEGQVQYLSQMNGLIRQQSEDLVVQKHQLMQDLQQTRAIATALVAASGGEIQVTQEILQQVDDGTLAGVNIVREEDGTMVVTITYGAIEETEEDEEES